MLAGCDRHADVVGVGGELGGYVDRLPAARVLADGGVHDAVSALAEPAPVVCAGGTPAGEYLFRGQVGVSGDAERVDRVPVSAAAPGEAGQERRDGPVQAGPVVVLAHGQVPEHVSYRPPSAPRRPLPAGLAEAGKERTQARGLGVEQGERIEPGQLPVIGHSASRLPASAIRAPPRVTDSIRSAAKAITRQATRARRPKKFRRIPGRCIQAPGPASRGRPERPDVGSLHRDPARAGRCR